MHITTSLLHLHYLGTSVSSEAAKTWDEESRFPEKTQEAFDLHKFY